jgi:hypothetical protein
VQKSLFHFIKVEQTLWELETTKQRPSPSMAKIQNPKTVVRVMRSEVAAPMHTARAIISSFLFGLRSAAGGLRTTWGSSATKLPKG